MKKVTSHRIKIFSLIAIVGALLSFGVWETVFATAGVSNYLSYQGRLTDTSGNPLGGAGTNYCFSFSVFDAASAGNIIWPTTSTSTSILNVVNGVFNASIGDVSSVNFSATNTPYLNVQVATQVGGVCTGVVWETLAPRQKLDSVVYARTARDVYGGDVQVGDASGTSGKFLKLDWKNTADTLGGACSGSSASQGWLWFNSFSNFTRICNNNIIKSLSGLTNDFFDISGPTVARTFAFPDASVTMLTSFTPVTIAQGGTGTTTATNAFNALSPITTKGDLISKDTTNNIRLGVGTNGQVLTASSTATAGIAWATISGGTNTLLDGSSHTDTLAGSVAQGDVIVGNATPKWARLAKGTSNQVLSMNGAGTDVVWVTPTGGGDMVLASAQTNSGLKIFNDATLGLRNVANTFTSLFTNTNTAARTYTLPDVSGTVLTSGAAVTVAQGGTGQITASAAFDALDPLTTIGDIIYGGTSGTATRLAGSAGFLKSTGAAAPAWSTINLAASADVGTSILPVADGGTGLATLTLNNLMLGNGTTAPTFVAPGTAGNLLQSNGTTWQSVVGGVLIGTQIKVAGNTTYTPTAGTTSIVIRMVGGGGGGGGATGTASSASVGGGGGSGGYAEKRFTGISSATTYTITVGTGGIAGVAANGTGGTGVTTTFVCPAACVPSSVTVTANGGIGGATAAAGTSVLSSMGGAGSGVSTNGDVNASGAPGAYAVRFSASTGQAGSGAPSAFSGGAKGLSTTGVGTTAVGYGGGGAGAVSFSTAANAGGAGAPGILIIREFR